MKILITGASGFIGYSLVERLAQSDNEIITFGRKEMITSNSAYHILGDICMPPYNIALDIVRSCDVIVHLAWQDVNDPLAKTHLTTQLDQQFCFLKWLIENGSKHLLIAGSCYEYGLQEGCLSEEMQEQPVTPYGQAKVELLKRIQQLQDTDSFILQWARLFYMCGNGQRQGIIPSLKRAIANNESYFGMSDGTQNRDYLPLKDVVEILFQMIITPELKGVVNCCSGEPITLRQLVDGHLKKWNTQIEIKEKFYPDRECEAHSFWGDNTKLKNYIKLPSSNLFES